MNNFPLFAVLVLVLLMSIGCGSLRAETPEDHPTSSWTYDTMVRLNGPDSPFNDKRYKKKGLTEADIKAKVYDENGNLKAIIIEE